MKLSAHHPLVRRTASRGIATGIAALLAVGSIVAATRSAFAAFPGPGGYTTRWDWVKHKRTIKYCVEPSLYQVPPPIIILPGDPPDTIRQDSVKVSLGGAVEFAASNWSNAGTGWRFVKVAWGAADCMLRFISHTLEDTLKKQGSWATAPEYIDRDEEDGPGYGPPDPETWRQPPGVSWLAFFSADPESTFRDSTKGNALKVKRARIVINTDAWWDIARGSLKYDPREIMMHEIGHAARLKHDDTNINDDTEIKPVGSKPGANVLSVGNGVDGMRQTTPRGDDQIVAGVGIDSGADGFVDTSPIDGLNPANLLAGPNVMSTQDRKGRHGVNPGNDHPPGSAYSLATNEWNSAKMSALDNGDKPTPPMPGVSGWALLILATTLLGLGAWWVRRYRLQGA